MLAGSIRRFAREERGAAMVEFAIVAVFFLIPMIFGIVEFGRMTWARTTLTAAAREGVRYAIVHGSTSGALADSAAVADYVEAKSQLGGIIVRTQWLSGQDPGDTVEVTVDYSYQSLIPVVPSRQLRGRSRQVIAY